MDDLFIGSDVTAAGPAVDSAADWVRRWTVSWRAEQGVLTSAVRDLDRLPLAVMQPMRRFTWTTGQRHRPGLQFMVSTGRHHGFESLAEQRLLLALDFAGSVRQVLGQPMRLRYTVEGQVREHVPDVLALTDNAVWLFDVRPAERIRPKDLPGFVAAARAAHEAGWRYAVVAGWQRQPLAAVEALSAQRRTLADPLGVQQELLAASASGPRPFGKLVEATSMPAVGRAHLLHLLWRRRLEVDLGQPLGDRTIVRPAPATGATG